MSILMSILKIALRVSLLAVVVGYTFAQTNKGIYTLTGSLKGFEDGTDFFLVNLDNEQKVTAARLNRQKVFFKGQVEEPAAHRLYFKDEKGNINDLNFWLENKAITITADKNNFSNAVIKGSPVNDINRAVVNQYRSLENERDVLMKEFLEETSDSKKDEILKTVSAIDRKVLATRVETIATFEPSLITVKELFFLRNDLSKQELKKLFDKFPISLKNTKYGNVIEQYIAAEDLEIGAKSADITGSDIEKRLFRLSDFKGKIVLLDFWASWCAPCRKSNRELAEAYRKYQPDGFEIVSFSADTNLASWQKASKDDGIFWTNISDLKGFYSEQLAAYKIRSLPRAFLIDKNGNVVHIFKGYNQESKKLLDNRIRELTR